MQFRDQDDSLTVPPGPSIFRQMRNKIIKNEFPSLNLTTTLYRDNSQDFLNCVDSHGCCLYLTVNIKKNVLTLQQFCSSWFVVTYLYFCISYFYCKRNIKRITYNNEKLQKRCIKVSKTGHAFITIYMTTVRYSERTRDVVCLSEK
jgi:hypothetical protein